MALPNFAMFSTELTKFQNLPQITNDQAILNGLQQLRETLDNGVQEINDRLQEINNKIEGLETRMKASTCNNIARIQNTARKTDVSRLIPLVHAATGDAIIGFPATIGALNAMTGPRIREILNALEEPETGTVPECRTRLLVAIGIVEIAL